MYVIVCRIAPDTPQVKEKTVGKLDGKNAVITGGSTGMALAGAKLFVDEGAHVFIQARRQDALDDAVKLIGRNVTAGAIGTAMLPVMSQGKTRSRPR